MCNMHVSKCLNVAVCSLPFSMLALYVSKLDLWICLSQHMCVLSLSFSHSEMHIGAHTKSIRPDLLSLTVQTVIHMTEGGWQCALSLANAAHTPAHMCYGRIDVHHTLITHRDTHTHTVSYVLAATHCNTSTSSTFLLHCHLSHTAHTVATHAATFRLFHLKRSCCAPIRRPSAVVRACVPFHSRHARWRMYCMHAILKCCLALSLAPKYLLLCVTTDRSCSRWVRHEAMPPHFSLHSSVVSAYSREQ